MTHHITLPASTAALAPAGMVVSTAPPSEVAAAIPLLSALVVGVFPQSVWVPTLGL